MAKEEGESGHREHKLIQGIVFKLVKRHIAGSTLSNALAMARNNNAVGLRSTITFLSNNVDDQTKARYNANAYVQLAREASRLQLNADVSLRLSQLGARLNDEVCDKCLSDIIKVMKEYNTRLWLESEDDLGMDGLFEAYRRCREEYSNVGIEVPIHYPLEVSTIKMHLKKNDMVKLTSYSHVKRLEEQIPQKGKKSKKEGEEIDKHLLENYLSNIGKLLQADVGVAVLEPDEKLIAKIAGFSKEYKKNLIFELPLGYSRRWLKRLAKMKINLSVYTPYGKDWTPYVIDKLTTGHGHLRQLAERVLSARHGGVEDEEA